MFCCAHCTHKVFLAQILGLWERSSGEILVQVLIHFFSLEMLVQILAHFFWIKWCHCNRYFLRGFYSGHTYKMSANDDNSHFINHTKRQQILGFLVSWLVEEWRCWLYTLCSTHSANFLWKIQNNLRFPGTGFGCLQKLPAVMLKMGRDKATMMSSPC